MDLNPRTPRVNFKLVIWIAIVTFVLCLMCVLLRVKLDGLMDAYAVRQLSRQVSLMAELVNEKIRVRLDALSETAKYIERDFDQMEYIVRSKQEPEEDTRLGVFSLEGDLYADSLNAISVQNFRCVMESFRGKPSVCYRQGTGLLISVPIFKGRNVRYVLYKLHYGHSLDGFFNVDCVEDKCFAAVLNDDEEVVLEALKGAWWNDSAWQAQDYDKIYGDLKGDLKKSNVAVRGGDVGGERYYFYRAELQRREFSLAGMISRARMVKGMEGISFLVFWVVGLLVSMFLMVLAVWYMMDRKHRERYRMLGSFIPEEKRLQENMDLLEQVGQEIRNPVLGILGMGAVIQKETRDATVKESARELQDMGQSLLTLADNVIDYSKVASQDDLDIVSAEYDLFALLSSCYAAVRNRNKGFRFNLQVDSSIPTRLYGDETRLRQIVSNIFWNAEMLLPDDSAKILIGFERDELASVDETSEGSMNLLITVPDSGNGWTGIGLMLVKRLVHLLRGEFREDCSIDGLPATVISLPQGVVKYEPMGDFKRRYDELVSSSESGGKHFYAPLASILVIDEVPMNLRVVEGILKETRVYLDAVSNGMEALEKFKRSRYDMIFLDHSMPIIEGMNILSIMKGLTGHPNENTPIVMLTGMPDVKARELCKQMGYADFLPKPIREESLFAMLLKYLPENLVHWYEANSENEIAEKQEKPMETAPLLEDQVLRDHEILESNEVVASTSEMPTLSPYLEKLRATEMIDVFVGLDCCGKNESLYRQRLRLFTEQTFDAELSKFLKAEDFENYRLVVRQLKAKALYIGAAEVASRSKSMEYACNNGDYGFVGFHHDELIQKYRALLKVLRETL